MSEDFQLTPQEVSVHYEISQRDLHKRSALYPGDAILCPICKKVHQTYALPKTDTELPYTVYSCSRDGVKYVGVAAIDHHEVLNLHFISPRPPEMRETPRQFFVESYKPNLN